MKNIIFFRTFLVSAFLILLGNSAHAQCNHSDDFSTFGKFTYSDNYVSPYYQTSSAGWEAEDACRHTIGSEELYLGGGKIAEYARGLLRSPLFSDGCTKVKLSYKPYLSQDTKLKVAIKQANNIVWSDTIIANDNTTWIEYSADVNITGEFNLILENVTNAESQLPSKDIYVKSICLTNNTTMGIAQSNYYDNITVYPNPFTDYIVINSTNNESVTIYDISGTLILQAVLKTGSNYINTSGLSGGVYVLKCGNNTLKILK